MFVVSLLAVFGSIRDESSVPNDDEVVVDECPVVFNITSYLIVFNITQVSALSSLWSVVTYSPGLARWMISHVRFVDRRVDSQYNVDTDHVCPCNSPAMYMVLQSVWSLLFSRLDVLRWWYAPCYSLLADVMTWNSPGLFVTLRQVPKVQGTVVTSQVQVGFIAHFDHESHRPSPMTTSSLSVPPPDFVGDVSGMAT